MLQKNKQQQIVLRDYQIKAIENTYRSFKINSKVALHLSTGAGKTIIATRIIKDVISKNKKCLFVVRRRNLVEQAFKSFKKHGISASVVMGNDRRFNPSCSLQVCSIDTVVNRNINKHDFALVIYDEAWDCTSKSYQEFMLSFPKKTKHLGLSGSFGFVGKKGHTFWQDIICPIEKMELIKQGSLVFPKVFAAKRIMETRVKTTGGDFNSKQLFEKNDKYHIYGSIVQEYITHANNKKAFLFAINIEHSKKIVSEFVNKGIKAVHVDSTNSKEEIKNALDDFENGETLILSNVGLFGVGTDIPCAEVMICARPTKSTNLWEQMCGRVMRPYKDKKFAIILDHGGNALRLGHPCNTFPAQREDKTSKSKEGIEIKSYQCPSCFYVYSENTTLCPNCSYRNEKRERIIKQQNEAKLFELKLENRPDLDWYFNYSSWYFSPKLRSNLFWHFSKYKNRNSDYLYLSQKIKNITPIEPRSGAELNITKAITNVIKRKHKPASIFFSIYEIEGHEDLIKMPRWFLQKVQS